MNNDPTPFRVNKYAKASTQDLEAELMRLTKENAELRKQNDELRSRLMDVDFDRLVAQDYT